MQRFVFVVQILIGLCLVASPVAAQIYKYVDAEGRVHFTDDPPAGVAAQQMEVEPNIIQGGPKPKTQPADQPSAAELRKKKLLEAKKAPKVELFVTSWCGYCTKAKAYLREKGIKFRVYDIEKDRQAARRKASLTSKRGVPFALIGDQKVTGFSRAAYDRALRAAR